MSYAPQSFPLLVPPDFKATRVVLPDGRTPCLTNPGPGYTSRGQHWPPEHPILYDSYDELRDSPPVPHHAMDITCADGTPVVAPNAGTVLTTWRYKGQTLPGAGSSPNGGHYVWIQDSSGTQHYFAHMKQIFVKPGQAVKARQIIGLCSDGGNAEGGCPHLHYATSTAAGVSFDPYPELDALYTAGGWQGTPIGWPLTPPWGAYAVAGAGALALGLAWWWKRRSDR